MQSHFINNEIRRVDLGDGQWVDVKRELSVADRDFIINRMFRGSNGESQSVTVDTVALLLASITDWSFVDADGKKLPVAEEHVNRLKPATAKLIQSRLGESPLGEEPTGLSTTTTDSEAVEST